MLKVFASVCKNDHSNVIELLMFSCHAVSRLDYVYAAGFFPRKNVMEFNV